MKKAFTLIELIIGVLIIGILSTTIYKYAIENKTQITTNQLLNSMTKSVFASLENIKDDDIEFSINNLYTYTNYDFNKDELYLYDEDENCKIFAGKQNDKLKKIIFDCSSISNDEKTLIKIENKLTSNIKLYSKPYEKANIVKDAKAIGVENQEITRGGNTQDAIVGIQGIK